MLTCSLRQVMRSALLCITGIYLSTVAAARTDRLYYAYYCMSQTRATMLFDVFKDASSVVSNYVIENGYNRYDAIDSCMFALLALTSGAIVVDNISSLAAKLQMVCRHMEVCGIVFTLRALCLTVTIFPSYDGDICPKLLMDMSAGRPNILISGFLMLFAPFTGVYAHVDYMFSGHTINATLLFMICMRTPHVRVHMYSIVCATLLYMTVLVMLILCRIHYTSDVLVGTIITCLSSLLYEHKLGRSD